MGADSQMSSDRDERATMHAALAFGGFTDAAETERVTVWAAKHIEALEAEVARLRAAIGETLCDDEPCARCRHLREALNGGETT